MCFSSVTVTHRHSQALFIWRGLPTYTGRANFSYISLQKVESRLHEKQNSPLRLHVHSSPYTLRSTTDQTHQTNQTMRQVSAQEKIKTMEKDKVVTPQKWSRSLARFQIQCFHWENFGIEVSYDERFDYSGITSRHEDRHKQVANIKTANPNSRATAKY